MRAEEGREGGSREGERKRWVREGSFCLRLKEMLGDISWTEMESR